MTPDMPEPLPAALSSNLFKPRFSKEAMLEQFFNATYHWAQGLAIAIGQAPVLRLLGPEGSARDYDWNAELPEEPATPKVIEELRTWEVTRFVERLYDYGVLGIAYDTARDMDSESPYTYTCAFLVDLMQSQVHEELESSTGVNFYPHLALEAAQMAHARFLLEDQSNEPFYRFAGQGEPGELTIRDIALLSGMEEKSVRNAANPKRASHLKTQSRERSTFIRPEDARAWLKERGRYIPLTRGYAEASVDLSSTSYPSLFDAWLFILGRYRSLGLSADDFGKLVGLADLRDPSEGKMAHVDPDWRVNTNFEFTSAMAQDASLMKRFAKALELPSDLFVMRMKEAALNDALSELRASIRTLTADTR